MNEISTAIRALRDAFRAVHLPYDRTGYYNIALTEEQITALQAEPDYAYFANQAKSSHLYFEGFRIARLWLAPAGLFCDPELSAEIEREHARDEATLQTLQLLQAVTVRRES